MYFHPFFIMLIILKITQQNQAIENFTNANIERDELGVVKVKRPFVNIFDQRHTLPQVIFGFPPPVVLVIKHLTQAQV